MPASSGLRIKEELNIRLDEAEFKKRMLVPNHDSRTKRSYSTLYNREAEIFFSILVGSQTKE